MILKHKESNFLKFSWKIRKTRILYRKSRKDMNYLLIEITYTLGMLYMLNNRNLFWIMIYLFYTETIIYFYYR